MPEEILLMDKITKVYPNGFVANKDVTFSINKGEIHALMGENGAGKSTLMKILFGIEPFEEGRIVLKGKEVRFNGHTAGAFRDNDGKVYIVSLKCPHLTCKLQFNWATKTWDCPCHGSRYDYKGNLLDNPSQAHSILIAIKD